MGLFDQKNCCICGGKAGMLTRQKLVDGSYLCGDCVAKCSPNLHMDDYNRMDRQTILAAMRHTVDNDDLYTHYFHETAAVKTGIMKGTKVILIDDNNAWWAPAAQSKPDVFTFAQVTGCQLMLDTQMKSEDEMKERKRPVYPTRADMPMCRPDEKITRMYVRVTVSHPFITYVDLNVMNAIFVTDGDIQSGYEAAGELYDLFNRNLYQQPQGYPNHTAPTSRPGVLSPADELKKYKELLDMHAITEQEYQAKKRQLLGL